MDSHNNIASILKGNITEVFNNLTVQINRSSNVKLAFIENSIDNNAQMLEDSNHYVSMLCPIRSPAFVFPESEADNHSYVYLDKANFITGIVYCQSSEYQDTLGNTSVIEGLLALKSQILMRICVQIPLHPQSQDSI